MKENKQIEQIEGLDFECAFEALQENVNRLEGEELSLEEALTLYKVGQALAKRCAKLLEEAELKVRNLATESTQISELEE